MKIRVSGIEPLQNDCIGSDIFGYTIRERVGVIMSCSIQMLTSNHTPSPCRPTTRVMVSAKLSLFRSTSSRLMWKSTFRTGYNPHPRSIGNVFRKGSIIDSSNGTADSGAMTKVLYLVKFFWL